MSAGLRSLPHFVIIGAQRAGTTSLYHWVTGHGECKAAFRKEPHYFDLHYDKGPNWYRAHFPLRTRGAVSGEGSPYLLFHPLAPERMARDLPPATVLIVLLRDPVDRAISQYRYERQLGFEHLDLVDAIAAEPTRLAGQAQILRAGGASFAHQHFSYVARGEYARQLRHWFEYFPRDAIHVFERSELIVRTEEQNRLLTLLGLDPDHQLPFPHHNATSFASAPGNEAAEREVRARLAEHFHPWNEDLATLLGRQWWA